MAEPKETKMVYLTDEQGRELVSLLEFTMETMERIASDDRHPDKVRSEANERYYLQQFILVKIR